MFVERKELMLSPHKNGDQIPNLGTCYLLKPTVNTDLPLPKRPSTSLPSQSHTSLLKASVSFKGRSVPLQKWGTWVDTLCQTHQETWREVGILDAIKGTTYNINCHNELLIGLAEKWCPETNTFVFSFGEATLTLEDVMILGGFSVLGECVRTTLVPSSEVEQIKVKLMKFFSDGKKDFSNLVLHTEWIELLRGFGGELEHIAFLVLWLSRYVFPAQCYEHIHLNVFPIAVALARGTRFALAPAILAAIYRDLRLLKAKIVDFVGEGKDNGSKLVLWAPLQLVQLWVWERFTILSPKPLSLLCGEPRLARWQGSRMVKASLFRFEFGSLGECFLWKPYALYVTDKAFYEFYCDEGKSVLLNSEVSEKLMSFARCLRPCELVGLDCIEQYLPHRVGMQFGYDQDIPCAVSRCNQSLEVAWSSYNEPLDDKTLYLPPRLLRGKVTAPYFNWLKTETCQHMAPRRRSWRIAKQKSRNAKLNGKPCDTGATICLSSSSNVSSKSIFVTDGEVVHDESITFPENRPSDFEAVSSQDRRAEDGSNFVNDGANDLPQSCKKAKFQMTHDLDICENKSSRSQDVDLTRVSKFVGSSVEVVNDMPFLCHDTPQRKNIDVASKVGEVSDIELPESAPKEDDRENDARSLYIDATDPPTKAFEMNTLSSVFPTNDVSGKAGNKDMVLSRMNNLVDNIIGICDGDEDNTSLVNFMEEDNGHDDGAAIFLSSASNVCNEILVHSDGVKMHTECSGSHDKTLTSGNANVNDCDTILSLNKNTLLASIDAISEVTASFGKRSVPDNANFNDCVIIPCQNKNTESPIVDVIKETTPSLDKSVHECENTSLYVDNIADYQNKRGVPPSPSQCNAPVNSEIEAIPSKSGAENVGVHESEIIPYDSRARVNESLPPCSNNAHIHKNASSHNPKRVRSDPSPNLDNVRLASDCSFGSEKKDKASKIQVRGELEIVSNCRDVTRTDMDSSYATSGFVNGSQHNPLILVDDDDDDNEDAAVKAVNMICSDFEDRIRELEATVQGLQQFLR